MHPNKAVEQSDHKLFLIDILAACRIVFIDILNAKIVFYSGRFDHHYFFFVVVGKRKVSFGVRIFKIKYDRF